MMVVLVVEKSAATALHVNVGLSLVGDSCSCVRSGRTQWGAWHIVWGTSPESLGVHRYTEACLSEGMAFILPASTCFKADKMTLTTREQPANNYSGEFPS